MGATMAKRKTSAEKARDEEEQSQLDGMLGDAFGDIGSLEQPPQESVDEPNEPVDAKPSEPTPDEPSNEPTANPPTGPPTGPPGGPPTGPPTGPPSGPPTGPPGAPQTGPPSSPPDEGSSDDAPAEAEETTAEKDEQAETSTLSDSTPEIEREATSEPATPADDKASKGPSQGEIPDEEAPEKPPEDEKTPLTVKDEGDASPLSAMTDQSALDLLAEKEAELERLHMENARLRQSVVGATEVIEALEEPPMPPLVEDNLVIPSYVVSDFVRLGRQLDREHLVRATMGSLAMIHPEQPSIMISTKHMVTLPRLNENSLCASQLGSSAPRHAPADWRVLEVVLASVSVVTGGPAAVIHMHGPHTTAASCEKDLILLTPLDEIGKQHIGKIIVVDPDPDSPEDYLRQVAEALNQGGMRCVVVRGNGAYAVGADFDQAWANAAMLEHSMQIHLLSRQANLKI